MTPRLATIADVPAIAELHAQAWEETYPGLVPPGEFVRRNLDKRLEIWGNILKSGMSVSYLPGIGFAHMGRNRVAERRNDYPRELFSFYTLQHAHGTGAGQALLAHAIGADFEPFTASVLKGNVRATAFYEKIGGVRLGESSEEIDGWTLTDILFGWSKPPKLV